MFFPQKHLHFSEMFRCHVWWHRSVIILIPIKKANGGQSPVFRHPVDPVAIQDFPCKIVSIIALVYPFYHHLGSLNQINAHGPHTKPWYNHRFCCVSPSKYLAIYALQSSISWINVSTKTHPRYISCYSYYATIIGSIMFNPHFVINHHICWYIYIYVCVWEYGIPCQYTFRREHDY